MTDKSARAERQEADDPAEPETRAGAPDIIYLPDDRQRTKKITSGSEKRQRTCAIRVRVLPADLERLKIEAAEAGISVAGYLASGRLGKETAYRPRLKIHRTTADVAAYLDGLVDLRRGNSLLNQETHAVNRIALVAEAQGCDDRMVEELAARRPVIEDIKQMFAAAVATIQAALSKSDDSEG
jgi:hypothetical protein